MTYKIIPDSDRVMKYVTSVWDFTEDGISDGDITPSKGGIVLPKGAIIVDHTLETIIAPGVSGAPLTTVAIKVGPTTPLAVTSWDNIADVNIMPTTNGKVMIDDRAVRFTFANSGNLNTTSGVRLAVTIGYLDSSNATSGL